MAIKLADTAWRSSVLHMLDKRDRYTQVCVMREFCKKMKDWDLSDTLTMHSDGKQDIFITPLGSNRYSVIWKFNKKENLAEVHAFLVSAPWPMMNREQLADCIYIESKKMEKDVFYRITKNLELES